uniref:head-tail connector protein n=1 Tax=Flavobacterium sp. TaxID=239 RepID=UPI0037C099FF
MWYPAAVAAPATEPVTLSQAKAHVRVDHSDDDTLLTATIKAARAHIEAACAVRFAPRTGVTMRCDGFADLARLPEAPVTSITSITYLDTAGASQTLATTVYELRADGIDAGIVLKPNQTWPAIQTGSRITVTAAIGYATVPEDAYHAMLMLIGHFYENRN